MDPNETTIEKAGSGPEEHGESKIFNVTWRNKIRNEAIRAKTKVKDITDKVREMRGQ